MKKILTPVLFFVILNLSKAQVVQSSVIDQDIKARTQTIAMDLIVQGSECVGVDCPTSQSFGFNTIVLKENNLRIKFEDTSNSGSFPSSDWTIEANGSANGSTNHFAILDDDNSRVPFKMIAGAPTNSIFLASSGNLGLGTATPAVEVHVANGDSPTLRLEQNTSAGFAAQTWDIAGNETNFFVRDVNNGSKLPFKIFPNAPTNSLTIEGTTGDIGIGTQSPEAALHVKRTSSSVNELMHIEGTGVVLTRLESADGGAIQFRIQSDNESNRRIIGVDNSDNVESQISMRDAGVIDFYSTTTATFTKLTAGSTGLTASSSRELKSNIKEVEIPNILDRISAVPVTTYNWRKELVGDKVSKNEVLGLIAQDFYGVFERGKNTEINGQDVQMALWMGVQQLHKDNNQLNTRINERDSIISELYEKIELLTEKLDALSSQILTNEQNVGLGSYDLPFLGQNYPNPYQHETVVEYYLPRNAATSYIQFTDLSGKLLRKVVLNDTGKGKIRITSGDIPVGVYQYSLVVDSVVIDTKQMILR